MIVSFQLLPMRKTKWIKFFKKLHKWPAIIIAFIAMLFAGTHFGLFRRNNKSDWEKLQLPIKNERITDLTIKADTLIILTRNYLLKTRNGETFQKIQLPEPINYKRETGLFDTFWQLHSGELFGLTGKLIVDLLGLVTIVLSITGLLHFFFPKIIRRRKRKAQTVKSLVSVKKKNLH